MTNKWIDGLPPVGEECEVAYEPQINRWWPDAQLICTCGDYIFFKREGKQKPLIRTINAVKFRPIKTPDEIERERLINAAKGIISQGVGDCEPDEYLATVLVNSGWTDKKVKPLLLEDFMRLLRAHNTVSGTHNDLVELGYIIGADND